MPSRATRKSTTRAPGASRSITGLYKEFEKADAAARALPSAEEKAFDRAMSKCAAMAKRIVKTPADGIEEMLLKIRVAVWGIGDLRYDSLEDLDRWRPTQHSKEAEYYALASLRADIRRLRVRIERDLDEVVASYKSSSDQQSQ